jgi:hypothetical protein
MTVWSRRFPARWVSVVLFAMTSLDFFALRRISRAWAQLHADARAAGIVM